MRNSELELLEAAIDQRDVARCVLSKRRNGTYFCRVKYIDSQGREHKVTVDLPDDQVDRIFSLVKKEYERVRRREDIHDQVLKRLRRSNRRR